MSERRRFLPCMANDGGRVKYFSIAGLLDLESGAGGCNFSAAGAGVFNEGLVGLECTRDSIDIVVPAAPLRSVAPTTQDAFLY